MAFDDYWWQQRYDDAAFAAEARRTEPDHAFIPDDDTLDPFTDRRGRVRTPGQWPAGGAL